MSNKLIVLFSPPMFLIGETHEWPPKKGEDFALDNSATLAAGVMQTPQGPQQVIQFQWMGVMNFRPGGWAAWRKPELGEEKAYQQFRAQRSGIALAGPGDVPPKSPLLS